MGNVKVIKAIFFYEILLCVFFFSLPFFHSLLPVRLLLPTSLQSLFSFLSKWCLSHNETCRLYAGSLGETFRNSGCYCPLIDWAQNKREVKSLLNRGDLCLISSESLNKITHSLSCLCRLISIYLCSLCADNMRDDVITTCRGADGWDSCCCSSCRSNRAQAHGLRKRSCFQPQAAHRWRWGLNPSSVPPSSTLLSSQPEAILAVLQVSPERVVK